MRPTPPATRSEIVVWVIAIYSIAVIFCMVWLDRHRPHPKPPPRVLEVSVDTGSGITIYQNEDGTIVATPY